MAAEATNEVPNTFQVPGFVTDIFDFFAAWKQLIDREAVPSFAHFKALWVTRKMSFIFGAKPNTVSKLEYFRVLCNAAFAYLCMDELPIKVGALYFLYMLHETQPVPYKYERERLREQQKVERGEPTYPRLQPRPPYQVQISIALWNVVNSLDDEILAFGGENMTPALNDVRAILHKTCSNNIWLFTATVEIIHPASLWGDPDLVGGDAAGNTGGLISKSTLEPIWDLLPVLEPLAAEYNTLMKSANIDVKVSNLYDRLHEILSRRTAEAEKRQKELERNITQQDNNDKLRRLLENPGEVLDGDVLDAGALMFTQLGTTLIHRSLDDD